MTQNKELLDKILESLSKIAFIEKKRILIFGDLKLYPSEIHLLLFIYFEQDTNITEIANRIGLTKGAVSQTLSRLQKKGILTKKTDPYNKNELKIMFTTQGDKLIKKIIEMKKEFEQEYLDYIKTLTEKDKKVISIFLDNLVTILIKKH